MITPAYAPTATDRVLPRMALDFTTGVLDSRVTIARSLNTATRVNSSGYIEIVNANLPRFDYNPVTLAPKGLLIEELRTNLYSYSEQFDNAYWTKSGSSVTVDATTSPDGTVNADKWVENTATAAHALTGSVIFAASTTYTATIYAKKSERNWLLIQFPTTPFGATTRCWFDIDTGALGTAANCTGSITEAGDGWYRCSITATATVGGTAGTSFYISTGNNVNSYAGDGTSGIFAWGAQLEAGAFATSYIPTVASTVSRSADNASMTGTNFSSWYNQPQGTFVVDADTVATGNRIIEASAGSLSRVVDIYTVSGPAVQMWNGTAAYSPFNNFTLGLPFKVAGAYQTANYAVVLNGGAVRTDAAVLVNTADSLQIGRFSSGTNYLNGHIRAIAYYNTRLTQC